MHALTPVFYCNYREWKRRHLRECPYVGRDDQRSSLSRTFLCFYSVAVCRCMYTKCPLAKGTMA